MPPEPRRPVQWLFRLARRHASEAELGDLHEEFASGTHRLLWLVRQVLSTIRLRRHDAAFHEGWFAMLSGVWADLRYALRTLRRDPAFAVAVLVPIVLGIGINTGVFSILNNVAFRSLPGDHPTELVNVYQEFQGVKKRRVHGARIMFSLPEYREYRAASRTLSGLAAYSMPWMATLGGRSPQDLEGVVVTCNFFEVLQLRVAVGPGFTPANCDDPRAPPAVVLSHALWTQRFGGEVDVIRKPVVLNGQAVAVVGVAPEGFDGLELTKSAFFASTALPRGQLDTVPIPLDFQDDAQLSWLALLGRRRSGIDVAQVRTELSAIAARIDREQPGRTTVVHVAPATALSLPHARREFFSVAAMVMAGFGLVLLIACANVANILLARAADRTAEIATRLSIGASRGRLMRQLLTESVVVASLGGAAGALLSWWSFQVLLQRVLSHMPGDIVQPRIDAHPDLTALGFALGLIVITALVCGVVPAVHASRLDPYTAMKPGRAGSGGRRPGWLRGGLIALQIAVCMLLLTSAGLLFRALHAVYTLEPGFEYRHVAVVSYALRGPRWDDASVAAYQRRVMERVQALPGVESVAQASKVPLSPGRQQTTFRVSKDGHEHLVDTNDVTPEYFSLLDIAILRGRTFTTSELTARSRAVIVSEATARHFWPGQDPVGRTVFIGADALEIVGVARDAHVAHLAETESSYMYLPAGPSAQRGLRVLVGSHVEFAALGNRITSAVRELDSDVIVRVKPLEGNLDYWRGRSSAAAGLAGVLSALALLLAVAGVYGVVSYVVSRRRREVSIRIALGASARDVSALIVRQALRPIAIGILTGVAASAAASRALESVLFGVSPFDPIAFVGAAMFLAALAQLAALLPIRRALRADPVTALRDE